MQQYYKTIPSTSGLNYLLRRVLADNKIVMIYLRIYLDLLLLFIDDPNRKSSAKNNVRTTLVQQVRSCIEMLSG